MTDASINLADQSGLASSIAILEASGPNRADSEVPAVVEESTDLLDLTDASIVSRLSLQGVAESKLTRHCKRRSCEGTQRS